MKYCLLLVFIIFYGCDSRERYLRSSLGMELHIDADSMLKGENRRLFLQELDKQIKIVVYTDSSNCSVCDLKLPLWRIQYKELNTRDNVGLIFIINTKNRDDIELNINATKVPGLQLYDTFGLFKKQNHLYEDRSLHVFLLDKHNKIILIGNPIENSKMLELYKEAIEMLSNAE